MRNTLQQQMRYSYALKCIYFRKIGTYVTLHISRFKTFDRYIPRNIVNIKIDTYVLHFMGAKTQFAVRLLV